MKTSLFEFSTQPLLRLFAAALCVVGTPYSVADEPLLPVDCVVNPSKQVDLSAAVSGVLESISVGRSDFVDQGQEVARLESTVELASVELATKRANIDAEVHLGEINLGFDRREKKRIAELYRKKAVSYRIKDESEREAKLSEWELQQARDLEDIRWLELKRAHAQLSQKIVRSSISGFVTKVHRFEGEYVEDQPIMRVVQLHPLFIEAIVPMKMFGRISNGMTAEVAPEATGAQKYNATVIAVDPMGDTASGTFGVRLELPNDDFKIPAGVKCGLRFDESSGAERTSPAIESRASQSDPTKATDQPSAATLAEFHYRFGPILDSEKLSEAKELLDTLNLSVSQEDGSVEKNRGYLVLAQHQQVEMHSQNEGAEQGAELEAKRIASLVAHLRQRGIDEYQVFGAGEHQGQVSLGVLYTPEAASAHKAKLASRGVSSRIEPRTQQLPASWLSVITSETQGTQLVAQMAQLSVQGERVSAP